MTEGNIMRHFLKRSGQGSILFLYCLSILTCLSAVWARIAAQPSGGPYGPVRQKYEVPTNVAAIYYVAPDGKPDASGRSLAESTTIERAIEKAKTGDAIILRGGTYRTGDLVFNQGVTMQPFADEEPIIKGTFIASEWKNISNGLWKTSWTRLFPASPDSWWSRDRYGKETPLHVFNNDIVFVDGTFLKSVGRESEVDEHSYYIDYAAKQVYIGADPAKHLVEITAFNFGLKRILVECYGRSADTRGPVIRGITFTQYAYCAIEIEGKEPEGISPESEHGKDVVGTIIEHCTLTFSSRVAAYLRGDKLILRHCKVSETSTEGIYIIGSSDVLLEKNIFSRNNIEHITGYYPAAVKIFNQSYRVTCRDNLITDLPLSNGIWYDVGNVDGVFVNNRVENVGNVHRELNPERPWPSENGFFFEISKGVVCAGNVFVNCDQGIFILNSSNAQIYNNTFVNSTVCISRNGRSPENDGMFGWHSGTGPGVESRDGHIFENNLMAGDESYLRPLMFVWQPATLCDRLSNPMLTRIDHNVYLISIAKPQCPMILWSPAKNERCQAMIESPEALQKMYPHLSVESKYYPSYAGQIFKSKELGDYQLLSSFPGALAGISIPQDVEKLLGRSKERMVYIGAYPPAP